MQIFKIDWDQELIRDQQLEKRPWKCGDHFELRTLKLLGAVKKSSLKQSKFICLSSVTIQSQVYFSA